MAKSWALAPDSHSPSLTAFSANGSASRYRPYSYRGMQVSGRACPARMATIGNLRAKVMSAKVLTYARVCARAALGFRSDCYSTWLERRRMATALLKSGHPVRKFFDADTPEGFLAPPNQFPTNSLIEKPGGIVGQDP